MSGERAVWGSLAGALVSLAAGWGWLLSGGAGIDPAPASAATSPRRDPTPSGPAPDVEGGGKGGSPAAEARRADAAIRRTLALWPRNLASLAAARSRCREALMLAEGARERDAGVVLRLKDLRIDLEARWREALDGEWLACRRHLALREWGEARAVLRRLRAAVGDPADRDSRKARQILLRLSER